MADVSGKRTAAADPCSTPQAAHTCGISWSLSGATSDASGTHKHASRVDGRQLQLGAGRFVSTRVMLMSAAKPAGSRSVRVTTDRAREVPGRTSLSRTSCSRGGAFVVGHGRWWAATASGAWACQRICACFSPLAPLAPMRAAARLAIIPWWRPRHPARMQRPLTRCARHATALMYASTNAGLATWPLHTGGAGSTCETAVFGSKAFAAPSRKAASAGLRTQRPAWRVQRAAPPPTQLMPSPAATPCGLRTVSAAISTAVWLLVSVTARVTLQTRRGVRVMLSAADEKPVVTLAKAPARKMGLRPGHATVQA